METLRSIAELMIWGDQHEPKFFEFFLEKQLLAQFHRILSFHSSDVQQQASRTWGCPQPPLQDFAHLHVHKPLEASVSRPGLAI